MRGVFSLPLGLLAVVVVTSQCGGSTAVITGDDASVDGATSDGSSSSSGGSSGGGSGSGSGSSSGSASSSSGGGSGSSSSSASGGSSGGGSGSSSGSSSSSGGGTCSPPCGQGRVCCSDACVNTDNDPDNCGGCGTKCGGNTPYCDGSCKAAPCPGINHCGAGETCCGFGPQGCCTQGQICCKMDGPQSYAQCFTPTATEPTCPQGCAPNCVSDRNLKRDIEPVDGKAALESVARMPIATWSYKSDPPNVRHMGPMAQDFYGEFGLGDTDRAYNPIDAHGVAFAAIQALYEQVQQQNARIERLERENEELRRRAP